MSKSPDLIVTNARIYTCDSSSPWAEALAVSGGAITAVGTSHQIDALATPATEVVNADGRMLMPGLTDIHAHLMFGGTQIAWELTTQPDDSLDAILAKVSAYSQTITADEWVIGGIVGSPVLDQLASGGYLAALDAAAGERPVLLRDDSYHNRWVNSKALELMGVDHSTPDPPDGTIVRDRDGNMTGVLYESACTLAERAAAASIDNQSARDRRAIRAAIEFMNSYGITAIQDAATLQPSLRALDELDDEGELTAWVVATLPVRPYMSDDIVGAELFAAAPGSRRHQIRPDFAKFFLDGVPMTRTSALLEPYICHGAHEDPTDTGSLLWTDDDLIAALERCHQLGLGAKLHATGDRSVRQALDAIQTVRERHGGLRYHISHVPFVAPSDLPRFAALDVVAEASPYIWFPTPMLASLNSQIPPSLADRSWPFRELLDHHAQLAVGSDWPIAHTPDPWMAMEALITRANPDPKHTGFSNPTAAITLDETISAFTRSNATAMGMGDTIGMLAPGRSADFIVLNNNLFDIETSAIHKTKVLQTYFRGRRVYGPTL
ncbi:amidohydrolase [Mycobacterium sp. 21AC1]|uniref:amidohydrolase n=1 Tax=[Mycobacterium] appelbergii TaxID=2939269 RepID=UPI002938D25D|nr:amidohydrolase [Mycobacterium sp. 21AC1]MDV3128358.1 amidohydrolase [Mycobacterium sp. 21AC1]